MKLKFVYKVVTAPLLFSLLFTQPIITNKKPSFDTLASPSPIQDALTHPFVVEVATGNIIQRPSFSGKRVLRNEYFSKQEIQRGLREGVFKRKKAEQLLALLDRSNTGIGITGGGDCAGIADCLSSLRQHLQPELNMVGVRYAGNGLSLPAPEFAKNRVLIDSLAARDFAGQSSTPLGSARKDPLKKPEDRRRAVANITGHAFFYGTGGNDHLKLLENIARQFPEMIVVGTFKSIDGDGFINGKPAQMLGFHSAVQNYREAVYGIAQSAATHEQWTVVETFGRKVGKLAFEAARRYPPGFDSLPREEQRKIEDFRDTVMILVPERAVSLQALAKQAKEIKETEGSVTIVVAEGFMPPELQSEMDRLAHDGYLKRLWEEKDLSIKQIPDLIELSNEQDPRNGLKTVLKDPELAAQFAKTVWESKLDDHGNITKLAGISRFIVQALYKLAEAPKVNLSIQNYEARGVSPTEYDQEMGRRIGKKMAELINDGVTGGKAVIYYEGINAMEEDPVVIDLVGVTADNTLDNAKIYNDAMLLRNGVFWAEKALGVSI